MLLAGLAASIFHLLLNDMAVYATTITNYCVPYHPTHGNATGCWPKKEQWGTLGNTLTGKLHYLDPNNYDECYAMEDDSFKIEQTAHGMCMQYHDCSKAFCQVSAAWNIPYYSVEAHNYGDIKKALDFARNHNIAVTVKTSGHSYSGSSTGYGTLMIWMHRFTKYGQIQNNFKDSCNTATVPTVLKIGGGQTWKEAYDAVGNKYHIVGGGGLSVSAAGGWLMGGGQSALSRNLGLGIDNVLQLEVVLADGSKVTADRCNAYSDLFWALRGGGGGTFGIVISALYKLYSVTNIVYTYFSVDDIVVYPWPHLLTYSFLDFWVDRSPHLDNRWGGYWTLNTFVMYFQGSREDADKTFINDVNAWIKSKSSEDQRKITFTVSSHDSYYNQRGGKWATTDKTGQIEFFIASRLVPKSFVVNDPAAAKSMLKWMVNNGFYTFNYILGLFVLLCLFSYRPSKINM